MENMLTLADLAESRAFERFHEILWKLTGVVLSLKHPDGSFAKMLCTHEEYNPICKMIQSDERGMRACQRYDKIHCQKAAKTRRGIRYFCHIGLIDIAVPIFIGNRHIASISSGQILPERQSEAGFEALWAKSRHLDIDKEDLRRAYWKSSYMPLSKVDAVLEQISFFAEYFCEMGVRLKTKSDPGTHPGIAWAKDYIADNFKYDISMDEVARHIGITKSHFCRLYKKETGVNFSRALNNYRIEQAKKLLVSTDWTVTQIAFESGYNCLPYFNRIFSKFTGLSPGKYRKENLGAGY